MKTVEKMEQELVSLRAAGRRIKELEAERDVLKADAERYRWLRSIDSTACITWPDDSADMGLALDILDAAIDVAMKEGK